MRQRSDREIVAAALAWRDAERLVRHRAAVFRDASEGTYNAACKRLDAAEDAAADAMDALRLALGLED